jgi:hypothetical protein
VRRLFAELSQDLKNIFIKLFIELKLTRTSWNFLAKQTTISSLKTSRRNHISNSKVISLIRLINHIVMMKCKCASLSPLQFSNNDSNEWNWIKKHKICKLMEPELKIVEKIVFCCSVEVKIESFSSTLLKI